MPVGGFYWYEYSLLAILISFLLISGLFDALMGILEVAFHFILSLDLILPCSSNSCKQKLRMNVNVDLYLLLDA